MDQKTILILGGYGNTGRCLARLLLQETDARLILAGRNREQAEGAAARLNADFAGNRVQGTRVDAADQQSLQDAFSGVDLVIVASSTARYVREIVAAALAAGTDYLDIQYAAHKVPALQSRAADIERAGRCFITEAGYHPGLPAALVRYAGRHFDSLERAVIGSVIKQDWNITLSEATVAEFVGEFKDYRPDVFKNGQWQKASMTSMGDFPRFDFGPPFGRRFCAPMAFEEMRTLPQLFPSLQETGFYIAGFNWFVDWLLLPVIMLALRLWPERALRPMGRLFQWGLKTFSSPPYGVVLKLEARGRQDGRAQEMEVSLYHEDGYMFTAIPVMACLLQYLDGSIRKPGLWLMGHLVDPDRLMQDMERLGIKVSLTNSAGVPS